MRVNDEEFWAATKTANPPPARLDLDPTNWPEELTDDQMGDGYGYCVIFAAERWAETMEPLLDGGESVAAVADETFKEVDDYLGTWGLTGFQYGAAVAILAQCWEHGEELRRWHNLATQLHDEGERANDTGGVLNPALMHVAKEQAEP